MGGDFEGCAAGERKRSKKQGREGGKKGGLEGGKRGIHTQVCFCCLLLGSRTFTAGEDKTNNSR